MSRFYVDRIALGNGDHEVHKEDCVFLPGTDHCIDLGIHKSGESAVNKAKIFYDQANGCYYCSDDCYKG